MPFNPVLRRVGFFDRPTFDICQGVMLGGLLVVVYCVFRQHISITDPCSSSISKIFSSVTGSELVLQITGSYMPIWMAMVFAGMAFYLCFQRRGHHGEADNATEKGRRAESVTPPTVGSGLRRFIRQINPYNLKDAFEEGFEKYPNSAFCVHVFPFGRVTVLTSRKLIDEMNRAPADSLSFDEVSQILIQPDHTSFGLSPQHHPIVVIQQNFNRRLGLLLPDLLDDIKLGVDSALDHAQEGWCSIVIHELAERVTSKVALRAIIGSPLCESREVSGLIYAFVTGATKSAFWINRFPRALHFLVGPLVSSMAKHQKALVRAIKPIVDGRRQMLKELGCEWVDKPNDYLMCLIESAPPGQNYESSCEGIAARLMQFSFASFHTSGNALSHLLFDLAVSSYSDMLRKEMSEIINYEGLTKWSMQRMRLTDSFMTESARLNPVGISVDRSCSIGLTSLSRFARQTYTFSHQRVIVPKGTVVMASMTSIHGDENVYPNPDTFDPWRFSNPKAPPSEVAKNQYTSITPHYLYFGHGKRACPGRFFADMELKAILCHIVMNYDLKVKDGLRPANDKPGIGVLPSTSAEIMMRRRCGIEDATW